MKPEQTQNESGADGATTSEAEVEALLVRAGQGDLGRATSSWPGTGPGCGG